MKLRSLAVSIALCVGAALSGFGQGSGPATPSATEVVIPDGTMIHAKLKQKLDANKLHVGDPVKLEVMFDVRDRVTGVLLVPKKAKLLATVSHVDFSKETEGATLSIEMTRAEWEGGAAELHSRITAVEAQTATVRYQGQRVPSSGPGSRTVCVPGDPTGASIGARTTQCYQVGGDHISQRAGPPQPGGQDQVSVRVFNGKLQFLSSNHSLPAGIIFSIEHRIPSAANKAFEPSRDAALKGDAEAQFQLGLMYHQGKGAAQDYAQAAEWYRKAAEQGLAKAQNNLAVLYAQGQGVPQDYVSAYMWFSVAAAAKPDKNKANLQLLEGQMTPEQIAEGKRRAEEWLKQHPASH